MTAPVLEFVKEGRLSSPKDEPIGLLIIPVRGPVAIATARPTGLTCCHAKVAACPVPAKGLTVLRTTIPPFVIITIDRTERPTTVIIHAAVAGGIEVQIIVTALDRKAIEQDGT